MNTTLSIRKLSALKSFETEKARWDAAVKKAEDASFFLTHDWLCLWWKYFGDDKELYIFIVENVSGEIIGLAPLMKVSSRRKGILIREIQFIAQDMGADLGFVLLEHPQAVLEAILNQLQIDDTWDLINLGHIPTQSDFYNLLAPAIEKRHLRCHYKPMEASPCISVGSSWNDYLKSKSKNFRLSMKRRNKIYQAHQQGVEILKLSTVSDMQRTIETMADIDRRSDRYTDGNVLFSNPQRIRFHQELATLLAQQKQIDIYLLMKDRRAIAYLYRIVHKGRHIYYNGACDQKYQAINPGHRLLDLCIEASFHHDDCKMIDLGVGVQTYKARWATHMREEMAVITPNRSSKGHLLDLLLFRFKPSIATMADKGRTIFNKRSLKNAAFDCLYWGGRLLSRRIRTPILAYHSVDNSGSLISVTPKAFKEQLALLHSHGYRTLPLETYAELLKRNQKAPPNSFVLTFDDGFENFTAKVLPILQTYNFHATVFLTTNYMGAHCNWIKDESVPRLNILRWNHVSALDAHGITFGAHSVSHPFLSTLTDEQIEFEVKESKKIIEQRLGKPITTFCYPYGDFDERVLQTVKQSGFSCACALSYGVKNDPSTVFKLNRLAIGPDTTLSYMKFIFSGFYDLNMARKQIVRTVING